MNKAVLEGIKIGGYYFIFKLAAIFIKYAIMCLIAAPNGSVSDHYHLGFIGYGSIAIIIIAFMFIWRAIMNNKISKSC